ncbi:HEAT repeat [Arenibacter nanhaiticus]|uniref:HEAT repeat n=1 Tax=Arenibacter nanhaiticus TaxID=558155 RepID=A0A1M6EYQ1_9FLAO|nr:family 16 glycoside hydrolase [Arenibacter nanhaiticus]SHI90587.1 HEAT repeat [Arenibacter nanhaiticus]
MNTLYKKLSVLLLFIGAFAMNAQDNRTLDTKVADILAQLPTEDLEHSDRLMQEIIDLGTDGVLKFSDMLIPLGSGDDTKARYAMQSVAVYSGGTQAIIKEGVVEKAILKALEKASNEEVKTFLIDRLMFCGTNASIVALKNYLSQEALFHPALAALTSIGTNEAAAAILNAVKGADSHKQASLVDALGELKYAAGETVLKELAASSSKTVQQKAIMALANIAGVSSYEVLANAVENSNYNLDDTNSVLAFIHYGNRLQEEGNKALSTTIANALLKNCKDEEQLHFRSAGVHILAANDGKGITKTLLKEAKNKDSKYVGAVLDAASDQLGYAEVAKWTKLYKKSSADIKPLVIRMLQTREDAVVFEKVILKALNDKHSNVRVAGIKALAYQDKVKALPELFKSLRKASTSEEFSALEGTFLRVVDAKDNELLAFQLNKVAEDAKVVLVNVLAARNANNQFDALLGLVNKGSDKVDAAIYKALPSIATGNNLSDLMVLLGKTEKEEYIENNQRAILNVLNGSDSDFSGKILSTYESAEDKSKLLPILAALSSEEALKMVSDRLSTGNKNEKALALKALTNWKNNDAIPYLFETAKNGSDNEIRKKAFGNYLTKVVRSNYPDDQKLLLVRKIMPEATNVQEKKQVLMAAQNIKTFLSLVFVSEYLDDQELLTTASNAAIAIALPTPGVKNGLSGDVVRDIVSRSVDNLTGPDSQYIKIDVKEFLDKMPNDKGFVSIFNGKDFTGWEGLVANPIARSKMSASKLAREQAKANAQMMEDWYIKDGVIGFKGEGYNNICTVKDYGDFEMLVDWKITNGGDSGIYLRGTPQVQIWDVALVEVGAQVGSGGLYNNQKHESKPLQVADNPVNEWNTFRIKMVGDRVTVHLNGVLVTDNVVMDNYWDRTQAIFAKEAIELQAHGEDLGFRNIYVREISSGDDQLTQAEKKEGFKSLLGGKDLDHWIGNKTDYIVENNELLVKPKQGGHGNLYTAEEYSDFVFRFDFKLTPGANNGLGIHAPLEGDVAYMGKELQILDNTAQIYANLDDHQYHGSVYGIMAAKRGALNPVGEWNSQEVIVKDDQIKITLNGKVILDGNIKEATKNGTLDKKDHPGLLRSKGHIAFLGHGSELAFRNIRIKDLSK